ARGGERVSRGKLASYSGPFRLEPARFETYHDLRNSRNRSLKLFMEVAWESRLRPIVVSQPMDQITVTAGGKPVTRDRQGEPAASISDGSTGVELEIPLSSPERSVAKIDSLKGQLKVLVPGSMETFRFADLPTGKDAANKKIEQRKASVAVTIEG